MNDNVMYIGVTGDLQRRLYEHKNHLVTGFTDKYNVDKLVYFEASDDIKEAINREKQIKGWVRAKKDALVESVNPEWIDLSSTWEK
jgi:putative endonuclease